jgi:hypothetical protein
MPESPYEAIKAQVPNLPANFTIFMTDAPEPPSGLVMLSGEGKLWVIYEYVGTGFSEVWLWHQDGETVTIPPEEETVLDSLPGDLLCYRLGAAGQPIKLGWAYL